MSTRTGFGAVLLTAVLAAAASGQVKPTAQSTALTAMDYIEIRQLANRYAFALDTGGNNGYDYADLFSADGEFMRPYAKGREQLAALARGGGKDRRQQRRPETCSCRHVNSYLTPCPSRAM